MMMMMMAMSLERQTKASYVVRHYRGFSLRSLLMYVVQSGLRMAAAANSTQIIDKHQRLNASNPLYELEIAVLRTCVLDCSMS